MWQVRECVQVDCLTPHQALRILQRYHRKGVLGEVVHEGKIYGLDGLKALLKGEPLTEYSSNGSILVVPASMVAA